MAAAASLAACLSACGTSHPNTTTAPGRTRTDAALAQQVLSEQLALLHRALPAGWRQNGTASDALTCADSATRAGRTGRAASPSFVYKRMEVRAGTYVFADSRAATRALPAFAAQALQGCRARFLVTRLRKRYSTGSPHVRSRALPDVGQGANTTEITVPTRYNDKCSPGTSTRRQSNRDA